ncbi:MAG: hypothetical protein ACLU99_14895 [Alphaproteobacteria bacterium]
MKSEIRVEVPADCRLVGVRTDGDVVVIIYEPIQNVRQIGFIHYPEPDDETEEPENKRVNMQYSLIKGLQPGKTRPLACVDRKTAIRK